MSADWNWYGEEEADSIIVKPVEPIAVYTNPDGDIVIRQRSMLDDQTDQVVVVPKHAAAAVIEAIKVALLESR